MERISWNDINELRVKAETEAKTASDLLNKAVERNDKSDREFYQLSALIHGRYASELRKIQGL